MQNELLKVADVEQILKLSRTKIYEIVHRQDFPAVRIGRSIRVPRHALERWIEQQAAARNGER